MVRFGAANAHPVRSGAVGRTAIAILSGLFAATQWCSPVAFTGAGLVTVPDRSVSPVALDALPTVRHPNTNKYKSLARYKTYDGFVFRKKRMPGTRIRLDRRGRSKDPFYRIQAAFQKGRNPGSGRYLEQIGWWDPMKEVRDPAFFHIKADRAVFWLRSGAQPTDMVANLLDMANIIRRLGPNSKQGDWEWRVPKESGPEAPESWTYRGPHRVTWANEPKINHRKGHPHNADKAKLVPLIERYGFRGFEKVPIDVDAATEPIAGSALSSVFPNTDLPLY